MFGFGSDLGVFGIGLLAGAASTSPGLLAAGVVLVGLAMAAAVTGLLRLVGVVWVGFPLSPK